MDDLLYEVELEGGAKVELEGGAPDGEMDCGLEDMNPASSLTLLVWSLARGCLRLDLAEDADQEALRRLAELGVVDRGALERLRGRDCSQRFGRLDRSTL